MDSAEQQHFGGLDARGVVRSLRFEGDDVALVYAIRSGHPGAKAELYDRYARMVERILARVLGVDPEIPDLIQEVYVQALANIDTVADPARLPSWLMAIAVHVARGTIRKRSRRRWLSLVSPDHLPELPTDDDREGREALRLTYEVLEKMPAEERIAFALRHVEGMNAAAVADAMGLSTATAKRRLSRAQKRFVTLASMVPALRERVRGAGGGR